MILEKLQSLKPVLPYNVTKKRMSQQYGMSLFLCTSKNDKCAAEKNGGLGAGLFLGWQ
jgi:hypothetical protein